MTKVVRNRETKEVVETHDKVIDFTENSVTLQAGKGKTIITYPPELEVVDEETE